MAGQQFFSSVSESAQTTIEQAGGTVNRNWYNPGENAFPHLVTFPAYTEEIRDHERMQREIKAFGNLADAKQNVAPYAWKLPNGMVVSYRDIVQ